MRILIINDERIYGGTEVQTMREMDNFRTKGHSVALLNFAKELPLSVEYNQDHLYNIPVKFNDFSKLWHRLFTSKKYQNLILKVIKIEKPEYIHINNIVYLPLDVYKCVNNLYTVQTIRDYSAICPKATCIYDDYTVCKGYRIGNCFKCIKNNRLKLLMKYVALYRINKYRNQCVNKCLAPSKALANACCFNELNTIAIPNPFDFKILKKQKPTLDTKIYFYYGAISEIKGVTKLVSTFDRFFKQNNNVELWLAGKVDSNYQKEFEKINNKSYIKYLGFISNKEVMEIYKNVYCVIVPSLWIENYPNTVLEAIANKTLVIGSNRGGIPELINNSDLLFDILDDEDILRKLNYTYNMKGEEYLKIVSEGFSRIYSDNNVDIYYNRIINLYEGKM